MKHNWKDVWKYGVVNETFRVFDTRNSFEKGQLDKWGEMMAEMIRAFLVIIILGVLGALLLKEGKFTQSIAGIAVVSIVALVCLVWSIPKIVRGLRHIRD